jgi:hypothetical protein
VGEIDISSGLIGSRALMRSLSGKEVTLKSEIQIEDIDTHTALDH